MNARDFLGIDSQRKKAAAALIDPLQLVDTSSKTAPITPNSHKHTLDTQPSGQPPQKKARKGNNTELDELRAMLEPEAPSTTTTTATPTLSAEEQEFLRTVDHLKKHGTRDSLMKYYAQMSEDTKNPQVQERAERLKNSLDAENFSVEANRQLCNEKYTLLIKYCDDSLKKNPNLKDAAQDFKQQAAAKLEMKKKFDETIETYTAEKEYQKVVDYCAKMLEENNLPSFTSHVTRILYEALEKQDTPSRAPSLSTSTTTATLSKTTKLPEKQKDEKDNKERIDKNAEKKSKNDAPKQPLTGAAAAAAVSSTDDFSEMSLAARRVFANRFSLPTAPFAQRASVDKDMALIKELSDLEDFLKAKNYLAAKMRWNILSHQYLDRKGELCAWRERKFLEMVAEFDNPSLNSSTSSSSSSSHPPAQPVRFLDVIDALLELNKEKDAENHIKAFEKKREDIAKDADQAKKQDAKLKDMERDIASAKQLFAKFKDSAKSPPTLTRGRFFNGTEYDFVKGILGPPMDEKAFKEEIEKLHKEWEKHIEEKKYDRALEVVDSLERFQDIKFYRQCLRKHHELQPENFQILFRYTAPPPISFPRKEDPSERKEKTDLLNNFIDRYPNSPQLNAAYHLLAVVHSHYQEHKLVRDTIERWSKLEKEKKNLSYDPLMRNMLANCYRLQSDSGIRATSPSLPDSDPIPDYNRPTVG